MAAASIANIVKSSLGPVGLDKMLVDDIGVSFLISGFRESNSDMRGWNLILLLLILLLHSIQSLRRLPFSRTSPSQTMEPRS